MPAHKIHFGPCVVDECSAPAEILAMCKKHYERQRRHGSLAPRMLDRSKSREQRFLEKVEKAECWLWTGSLNNRGYGQFWNGDRLVLAHRWAYEQYVGPIPDGLFLDHFVCERPACVNPAHVRPVSPRENTLRGASISSAMLAKTHCLRGHPFDEANTLVSRGGRFCRACRRLRQAGSAPRV